jgi:glycosyltransferase involved in cell wall biosynthesis
MLYRKIEGSVRRREIDIVEVPDSKGWHALWPALQVPIITKIHGSLTYFARELNRPIPRRHVWTERLGLRRSDFWYSCSRYAAAKTLSLFDLTEPDEIIYNPAAEPHDFDCSRPAGIAQRSSHEVVFTGTLTPKKGIFSLIDAWGKIRRACPDAHLHIYGKDVAKPWPMKEKLLARMAEADRGTVTFHGHASQEVLRDALRSARLAVFPSYAEAFALAPMEAMAQGCPTVYSRRTSGPELITHGQDGWLVDPDKIEEISGAVVALLQDDALANRLSLAGHKRIESRFTVKTILAETLRLYQCCVSSFRERQGRRKAITVSPRYEKNTACISR